MDSPSLQAKYDRHSQERDVFTKAILSSDSWKKVILAGPGTGKSFLFQKICEENKQGKNKNLALSFINELVDDLAKDLDQLATVHTLHSFALSKLPGSKGVYINLGDIISKDYKVVKGNDIDYSDLLCNLKGELDDLTFYSDRRKYYNFYSPNCSVYTLVKVFENDESKIPVRAQILIDEFQDFNKLETKLIDLLGKKSPALFAGDDDQSLYQKLKHAHPEEIRSRWVSDEYDQFELPFCTRCTQVTLRAYKSVVDNAKSAGFLQQRGEKKYEYFPEPEKDEISDKNPKILIRKKVYSSNIAHNIKREIEEVLDPRDKNQPKSILVITPYSKHIPDIAERLRAKGFRNIIASYKEDSAELVEAINLLLKDAKCNLGWRMATEHYFIKNQKESEFEIIIRNSCLSENKSKKFMNLLEVEDRKAIKSIVACIRKMLKSEIVTEEARETAYKFLDYDLHGLALGKLNKDTTTKYHVRNLHKDVPIKITTIAGSKGLTQDYVFLVNFDDKYLLERQADGSLAITDQCIHSFLVALTRAKTRTYIFTGENKLSALAEWMGNNNYEEI